MYANSVLRRTTGRDNQPNAKALDKIPHELHTHVQYTQTDTIRQTDGPLVPMVGLVPTEKDVIPMVLLVNMHLIKGTLIIFPCDLAGYGAIPMVHWYQ